MRRQSFVKAALVAASAVALSAAAMDASLAGQSYSKPAGGSSFNYSHTEAKASVNWFGVYATGEGTSISASHGPAFAGGGGTYSARASSTEFGSTQCCTDNLSTQSIGGGYSSNSASVHGSVHSFASSH